MNAFPVSAILLAAGSSARMGEDENGSRLNKLLLRFNGVTPIELCIKTFSRYCSELVLVVSEATLETARNAAAQAGVPAKIVFGGKLRQDSVIAGLRAASNPYVAIHDCARALVSGRVIERALASAMEFGSGVAALAVRDTLRIGETGETVPREGLFQMQTPQCFERIKLIEAYSLVSGEHTDDASIWRAAYGSVRLTEGELHNQKLTTRDDIPFFKRMTAKMPHIRVGIGEDTHRLTEGRKLVLGGTEIPFRLGLLGHSDADALIHAVIDAMLGASALGDIGRHFPDSDPGYKGISSVVLLEKTAALLEQNGFTVSNIDAVITAQEPKLAPYIDLMRKTIADAIPRVGMENISIKATTPEHLGPEGSLECITVRAVALVVGG